MGQLDNLQDGFNREVALRGVVYRSSLIGYDGDPNGGSAPAVLQDCSPGTMYQRDSTGESYVKETVSATSWTRLSKFSDAQSTTTPITVDIDPAAGDYRPLDDDAQFFNQTDVDAWLASKGETAFRYPMDLLEVLPFTWLYRVKLILKAGTHRGRPGADYDGNGHTYPIWLVGFKMDTGDPAVSSYNDGYLIVEGEFAGHEKDDWTVDHVGGTCTAYQITDEVTGEYEPYYDFAPGTFPNDGTLIGKIAYQANDGSGSSRIIYDHTDSRLYVNENIDTSPVATTIDVRVPAVIMRLGTGQPGLKIDVTQISPGAASRQWIFQNFSIEPTGGYGESIFIRGVLSMQFDEMSVSNYGVSPGDSYSCFGLYGANGARGNFATFRFIGCSFYDSLASGHTLNSVRCQGTYTGILHLNGCVVYANSTTSISGPGIGALRVYGCIIVDSSGHNAITTFGSDYGLCELFFNTNSGFPNLILRHTGVRGGVFVAKNARWKVSYGCDIHFDTLAGPAIRVESYAHILLTDSAESNLHTRGGIADVGWDLVGPFMMVAIMDSAIDITGTSGDVRLPDGSIVTYASLVGGVAPAFQNYMERLT